MSIIKFFRNSLNEYIFNEMIDEIKEEQLNI